MMSQMFRQCTLWCLRTLVAVWLLVVFAVLFFNVRLYVQSPLTRDQDTIPPQLRAQLAANRAALEAGAPGQMQELFPEGYYFSYLFHGLASVELAMRDPSYTEQAIEEASWCLEKLDSPEGRAPFPAGLPPGHGMFYSAWKCSLRGGIVVVQQGKNAEQLEAWRNECDAIAAALKASTTPFLPSYEGLAWPCDTVPAIHALCAYDRVTKEARYEALVGRWLEAANKRLDPETGLLPHMTFVIDGQPAEVARATSQVIMLRLLPDIDVEFAREQYEIFRERYLTTFLGAPCALEYPSGVAGEGDVDSGPLIFGRSLSATVFTMGVAQVYGDQELADAIAQCGEVIGLPWTADGQKNYVGGLLPIGDIMVAYAQVARPWFAGQAHYPATAHSVSAAWRLPIHAVSLLVFVPVALFAWRRRRQRVRHLQSSDDLDVGAVDPAG